MLHNFIIKSRLIITIVIHLLKNILYYLAKMENDDGVFSLVKGIYLKY